MVNEEVAQEELVSEAEWSEIKFKKPIILILRE